MPPDPSQADDLKESLDRLKARLERDRLFRAYYRGQQRLVYTSEKFWSTFGKLFTDLADNLCSSITDAVADRLVLVGFQVEDGPEKVGELAWQIWQANRMDRRAGEVHVEALRQGDAYVIVWPGADGQPIIHPQRSDQALVIYDEDVPGKIAWGAKVWVARDKRVRATLYYDDRIERWATEHPVEGGVLPDRPNAFEPYRQTGDGGWPLPNPYGRPPIFHFANNAPTGELGISELANVLPIQDALNFSLASMLVAMEYVALPQRWIVGAEVPTDPATGKALQTPFTPGVDRIWTVGDSDAKFGQFEPAPMDGFLKVQADLRNEVARVSATPLHHLLLNSGNWPSGSALRTSEARYLAKVRDRMLSYGNTWEDVMAFALEINGGPGGVRLRTEWKDPEPRSELDFAQTLAIKHRDLQVPLAQCWRESGYTDAEVERMLREREEEQQQALERQAAMAEATRPPQPAQQGTSPPGGNRPRDTTSDNRKGDSGRPGDRS